VDRVQELKGRLDDREDLRGRAGRAHLAALGDYYYDALTTTDVQRWIDNAIKRGWTIEVVNDQGEVVKQRRAYARNSIAVWFRVFRTMTRDAMMALNLPRDPTLRVELPDAPMDHSEPNALSPEQLVDFLEAMREKSPQHYAIVCTLAYTGLRWCHASALRWEDFDEEAGIIRVLRKQVRGKVGPISRKKRAPKEYPIEPELVEILKWHRRRLLEEQAPGLAAGWMFPSSAGTLRRANVDVVIRRALTGHVTEEMQRRYSTVGMDEKRAATCWRNSSGPTGASRGVSARRGRWDQRWDRRSREGNGLMRTTSIRPESRRFVGAGYRIRTGDLQLGKLTLYR